MSSVELLRRMKISSETEGADRFSFSNPNQNQGICKLSNDSTNHSLKITRLSADLGVPLSLSFFALAFKFQAVSNCCFSKEEFIKGLKSLLIDSKTKLIEALEQIEDFANSNIEKIFLFSFHLLIENKHQKLISLRDSVETIKILLNGLPHTNDFVNFLLNQQTYKGLNFDQWKMFFLFINIVGPSYQGYDIRDAWPVIIDDFVLHQRSKYSPYHEDIFSNQEEEDDENSETCSEEENNLVMASEIDWKKDKYQLLDNINSANIWENGMYV